MMKPLRKAFLVVFALAIAQVVVGQDASMFKTMKWRAVGPANMGGRVTDIAGIPGDPSTFYFGGADGGVFRTTNGGVTFDALFEDQRAFSVGALTLAPSDQNVIWLGSGEGDPRNSVGYGNGVYRSLDGGDSWDHLGLDKTERIKRIVVNPNNPDEACVCALGKEWGANPERGVFKTADGGKSWKKVLYLDEDTGCSELVMEFDNPRIMYAGMWTFRRLPWRFDDGGANTGLYRSLDGGDTWEKLSNGLPEGSMTRIGIAIAQSQPSTVYMISEFEKGGTLFRSDNRGKSWRMVNDDPNINFRPFYYSDIRVDPNNPEVVYSLSGRLMKSMDGGKSFETIARGVHGDHQALWIDPDNSNRVLSGSDGGYQLSFDAGATWDIINNVELSQFYQMDIDNLEPYNIYGGLQDNGTWVGPSNSLYNAGIMKRHWKKLAGGDGYYAVPIPGSENEIYANLQGGVIFHVDTRTGNVRNIHPYPKITGSAGDAIENHKYRFNWDSPIHISPHDPNTVFFGGNVVFKSSDRGHSWEEISPDLTTNDKSKQRTSGGEVYQDNTAAEFHCSILTIAESPVEKGVIWVGTDDGNLQVSRDNGANWANVNKNIKGLPAFAWIGKIHASEHDAGTAFVAVDNHRSDDFTPHIYKTTNYGKSWTKIVNGLPADDYVKVVRQDPTYPEVLYAGMEHGIFMSWNSGSSWLKINNNLPPASVRDLRIQPRERDLIVGTHGRGAWILDDIEGMRNLAKVKNADFETFKVKDVVFWQYYSQMENLGSRTYRAKNPEWGAYIDFYASAGNGKSVEIEISDLNGKLVRKIEQKKLVNGLNRVIWPLDGQGATPLNNNTASGWWSGAMRPWAIPGTYTAVIKYDGMEQSQNIVIKPDPRFDLTQDDYKLIETTLADIVKLLSGAHEMINDSDNLHMQLSDLKSKLKKADNEEYTEVIADIDNAMEEVDALRDELRRPPPSMSYRQRPRLREEIRSLGRAIGGPTAVPTKSQLARIVQLGEESEVLSKQYDSLLQGPVKDINSKLQGTPQIMVGKIHTN